MIEPGSEAGYSRMLTRWIEQLPLTRHGPLVGLVATLTIFGLAWLIRIAADPLLPIGFPYVTFFPAVIITSFLFGSRLGSLSALLCGLVAWYYFVPPVHSFGVRGTGVALAFYVFVVITDVALVHGMQTANKQLIKEREINRKLAVAKEQMVDELELRDSERKAAMDALVESEVKTHLATQTAGIGLWQWNIATGDVRWDSTMFDLYGIAPSADGTVRYDDYIGSVHADDASAQNDILQETMRTCGASDREFRIRRPDDGSIRHLRAVEVARAGPDGTTEWVLGTNLDITEQKNRENHVMLLMGEINHRAKNMLSVVMSVAHHTRAKDSAEFMKSFSARIQALAAGQDVLVRSEWKGVQVEALVRAQLNHFRDLFCDRIIMSGDEVFLSSAAVQTIGMALHELATNASKYGALSNETGRIAIGWHRVPGIPADRFMMFWTESDGPLVVPPESFGFGSSVIGRMVMLSLDGEVISSFKPSGFTWQLDCALENVIENAA